MEHKGIKIRKLLKIDNMKMINQNSKRKKKTKKEKELKNDGTKRR